MSSASGSICTNSSRLTRGAAKLGKPLRKRRAKLRALAAGAHDPHAERGAELADIEPDATGADDTGRLPVNQQRPIRPMVEGAGLAIHGGAGQILREIQNPGNRVFRHGQRTADTARSRHEYVAAPEIAGQQIAGARGPLVKPFELWSSGAQIERKRPAAEDHFRLCEHTIAFLTGALPR